MQKTNIFEIGGMKFPSGRHTRVVIGGNGALQGSHFCQGYVVIYPGGTVPVHEHETVESYTILQGQGEVQVGNEKEPVMPGDCIFVESGKVHAVYNTGESDLHMMFVYAPSMVAEHWAQEMSGELK